MAPRNSHQCQAISQAPLSIHENFKKNDLSEIEDFVETHMRKLCVIPRSCALRVLIGPHSGYTVRIRGRQKSNAAEFKEWVYHTCSGQPALLRRHCCLYMPRYYLRRMVTRGKSSTKSRSFEPGVYNTYSCSSETLIRYVPEGRYQQHYMQFIKLLYTSAVSSTNWVVDTQLFKLRNTSVPYFVHAMGVVHNSLPVCTYIPVGNTNEYLYIQVKCKCMYQNVQTSRCCSVSHPSAFLTRSFEPFSPVLQI